jgi:hypothetical protein
VANINRASSQLIKTGDTFVFALDKAAANVELENNLLVSSPSFSPSDFGTSFDAAAGEVRIIYLGADRPFAAGDSFGVRVTFDDPTHLSSNGATGRGVIEASGERRYNDFQATSLQLTTLAEEESAQRESQTPTRGSRRAEGQQSGRLPQLNLLRQSTMAATGSDVTTYTFSTTVYDHSVKRGRFTCPLGKLALNGGFTILGQDDDNFNLGAFGVRPKLASSGPGDDPALWSVIVHNATDNAVLGNFYFMCATR